MSSWDRLQGVEPSAPYRVGLLAELDEARQLNRRYRAALQRIATADETSWCEDYALCGHVGCKASHEHTEIAHRALDVESSF